MIKNIKIYFQGVWTEAKKVTWPSKKEVKNHTIIVIATIIIAMVVFGFMDFGFSKLLQMLLQ